MVVIPHLVIVIFFPMTHLIVQVDVQTRLLWLDPSNHCSGENIRDDTRSLSAVNLSPLVHNVVSSVSSARNEPK